MPNKDDLEAHLMRQFQQLTPDAPAPEALREEVFRTLDLLDLAGEVTALFTEKLGRSGLEFFELLDDAPTDEA